MYLEYSNSRSLVSNNFLLGIVQCTGMLPVHKVSLQLPKNEKFQTSVDPTPIYPFLFFLDFCLWISGDTLTFACFGIFSWSNISSKTASKMHEAPWIFSMAVFICFTCFYLFYLPLTGTDWLKCLYIHRLKCSKFMGWIGNL